MAAGGRQLVLPMPNGLGSGGSSSIAAQVRRNGSDSGWEVSLLPAVRVENRLSAPVHVCLSREGGDQAGSPGASRDGAQHQHQALEVPSRGSTEVLLLGNDTLLRLWLGGDVASGTGWSQAIGLLPHSHQRQQGHGQQKEAVLMVLHSSPAAAATALAAGVRPPAAPWAATQQLGAVLAQAVPPSAATGQACIRFWPPLLLQNATPCPLRLLLPPLGARQAQRGASAGPEHAQHEQQVLLTPGGSHQLTVPLHGGTVGALLSLQAGTCSDSTAAGVSDDEATSRSLSLVVPPLIAESADQQWFGSSGPKRAPGSEEAAQAVYIAPPGEATWLRLPLVMSGTGNVLEGTATESTCTGGGSRSSVCTSDLLLATQQDADGLPLLRLTLQPALAVHNCLPVPLLFQVGSAVMGEQAVAVCRHCQARVAMPGDCLLAAA